MAQLKSNKAKVLGLVALISVLGIASVYAFGGIGRGPGSGPMKGLAAMQSYLDLSDNQVQKIMDIGHKYRKLFYQNRNNSSKLYELRQKRRDKVLSVLTKEQKEKWLDARANRMRGPKRGPRRGNGRGYGRGPCSRYQK